MVVRRPVDEDIEYKKPSLRAFVFRILYSRSVRRAVLFVLFVVDVRAHATWILHSRIIRTPKRVLLNALSLVLRPVFYVLRVVDARAHAKTILRSRIVRTPRRIVLRVLGRVLRLVSYPIGVVVHTIGRFLRKWIVSRPFSLLLWGLPAVVVLLAVGILVLTAGRVSSSDLIVRYRESAREAIDLGDMKAATLWLEKTTQLNPNDPMHKFGLAVTIDQDGHRDRARQIMRRIAPDAAEGYPDAHFWLAQDLIQRAIPISSETAKTIEHHLRQSLRSEQFKCEAHALLGHLLLDRREWRQALSHFQVAAQEIPEHHFLLAELYDRLGQPERMARSARLAAEHYSQLAEAEPDVCEHRLRWSRAELLRRDYSKAVAILQQGLDKAADPEPLREALVAACLDWLGDVTKRERHNLGKQLDILNIGFRNSPNSPQVLGLIANLAIRERESTDSGRAAWLGNALKLSLATGSAPALVHLILGTRDIQYGRADSARMHLELAHEANPNIPLVVNSLALGLANEQPPDLGHALELIDMAGRLSDYPELRGTRAVVLAAMGRRQDAILQLRALMGVHPDPNWVRENLANLYRQAEDEGSVEDRGRPTWADAFPETQIVFLQEMRSHAAEVVLRRSRQLHRLIFEDCLSFPR